MCAFLDFRNGVNADRRAYGTGVPFINVLEVISNTCLVSEDVPGRISLSAQQIASYEVRYGDILFNRTSETQEEVGLASVYVGHEPIVFGGFVIRARPNPSLLDPSFSAYGLRSQAVRSQIIARGQGAVRANVGQADLRTVLVALPPLEEQRAIAAALSDADALIASLDALVAKKRDIKQGAMQRLLTGRMRLPSFDGTWTERLFFDALKIASSLVDPRPPPYRDMVLVAPDHVEEGSGKLMARSTASEQGAISGKYVFRPGDLVYSKIRPNLRKVVLADIDGLCSADMYPLSPAQGVWGEYVFHLMLHDAFSQYAESVSFRSGIPKVNREELAKYKFMMPDLEEQRAIAATLSDMDAEIAALEAQRDKAHAIKQAMMQQLLTGRVRLV